MRTGFEKSLAIQFGLAVTLLLAAGVLSYRNVTGSEATIRGIAETYNKLQAIDRIVSLLKDAEIGQRGYLLSGSAAYLDPFAAAGARLERELAGLGEMTDADRAQRARIEKLRTLTEKRIAELKESIELRRAGKLDLALAVTSIDKGNPSMEAIRSLVDEMKGAEDVQLRRWSFTSSLGALWAFAVAITANLVLLGFAFRSMGRELSERRQSEVALSRLASIVACSEDAVIGSELDGTITSWNLGAERLYGYAAAEVVGKPLNLLALPEGRKSVSDQLERIKFGERIATHERVDLRRDGTPISVSASLSPIKDRSGAITGVSGIIRDITEQKQACEVLLQRTADLEAAQSRLSATAEFGAALNQIEMLETYQSALGCVSRIARLPLAVVYDVGGERGAPAALCAVGPDQQPVEAALFCGAGLPAAVIRSGEIQTIAGPFQEPGLRLRLGLGEAALESVIGWPIRFQGRTIGALVTAQLAALDQRSSEFISASLDQLAVRMHGFQVEQQRLRLLTDLQVQSKALEVARADAERASRVKSEFLANMSHELRTPMNSIMGFTSRLLKKLGARLPERELDALQTVDRNAKHLLNLINNILDLSKIEAGKVELHAINFDLAAAIREAVQQAAPLADGKPVEVVLDLPGRPFFVDGDRTMLSQVVLNLLSNAIKFTDRGTVTITLDEAEDAGLGRVARLVVRDTGIGIKPEDRGRLFQQFTQLDGGTTRRVGGTGLGLAISARFVRMHGGRIDVSGEFGRGSEFAVVLPLENRAAAARTDPMREAPAFARAAPERPPQRPQAQPQCALLAAVASVEEAASPSEANLSLPASGPVRQGATILCVDDEPDVLKFLHLTFEEAGYTVMLAHDHAGALECARTRRPDLICLDLCMPGKDGFDVMNDLRADPELARVPVLVISVNSEEARALAAGARCYLAKPVDGEDLVATVRDLLKLEGGRILVVEDDPDTRRLLAETISEYGFQVRSAANGRDALDRLAEATPDLIVSDLMMPVMDGFTFLGQLQQDPVWSRVPVVILTAKNLHQEEIAQLNRVGAAILTKGRRDTELVVETILKSIRPGSKDLAGAAT
jgi:PAS domain S-box-containing protein